MKGEYLKDAFFFFNMMAFIPTIHSLVEVKKGNVKIETGTAFSASLLD